MDLRRTSVFGFGNTERGQFPLQVMVALIFLIKYMFFAFVANFAVDLKQDHNFQTDVKVTCLHFHFPCSLADIFEKNK